MPAAPTRIVVTANIAADQRSPIALPNGPARPASV